MSKRDDDVTNGMQPALKVGLIAGFVVLCLVASVVPMAFGEPFGWYGRLWCGVIAVVYFPLVLLFMELGTDRSIRVWELVRRSKGDDVREPSREERRQYRARH